MYQVDWIEAAVQRLADAWAEAASTERAAITAAANRIDKLLSRDPLDAGESRTANRRIVIEDPLAAVYEVDETARRVTVHDVNVRKHSK